MAAGKFFKGTSYSSATTGESLKSYLAFLGPENAYGSLLAELMDTQFATAEAAIKGLSVNPHEQVSTDNNRMLSTFDALQRNLTYMKTDMVSAMSISIDYVDSDGK